MSNYKLLTRDYLMQWSLFKIVSAFVICLLLVNVGLDNSPVRAQTRSDLPIALEVPIGPTPVKGEGNMNLAYELHLTNFRALDLTLKRIEVYVDDKDTPIADLEGAELRNCIFRPGVTSDSADVCLIKGGMRYIVYMWLTVEEEGNLPNTLYHRLYFTLKNSAGEDIERVVDDFPVIVRSDKPLVLSPPISGSDWLLANGPSNSSDHRRFVTAIDGKVRAGQRFAIDLMKFGEDGKLVHGDASKNENWISYGEQVLATADGIVSAVNDSVPENVPLAPHRAVKMTRENIGGNYIIIDLGNNRFAFYGHLQPGSIRVKVGDRVRRGQVLATLGNTGNSDAPHLHFHIADANDLFAAEGLPFVFESFDVLRILTLSQIEQILIEGTSWDDTKDAKISNRRMEIPMGHAVIRFH
jgi:murein DD-endopeptidase MepM/ murein hydrolase activator NlpD